MNPCLIFGQVRWGGFAFGLGAVFAPHCRNARVILVDGRRFLAECERRRQLWSIQDLDRPELAEMMLLTCRDKHDLLHLIM